VSVIGLEQSAKSDPIDLQLLAAIDASRRRRIDRVRRVPVYVKFISIS